VLEKDDQPSALVVEATAMQEGYLAGKPTVSAPDPELPAEQTQITPFAAALSKAALTVLPGSPELPKLKLATLIPLATHQSRAEMQWLNEPLPVELRTFRA
jgi:hypothetical protein